MSVKASNWVWHGLPTDLDDQIKHPHFVVLHALADIAGDDGVCTYGDPENRKQPALAKKSRMSESTFRRKVRDLEEMGLVGVDIRGLQNVYRLNFEWPKPLELSTGHSDRWETARKVAASRRGISRVDRSHRSTVTGQGNVIHKDLNQSVSELTTGGPAQSDGLIPRPSPARIPSHPQTVDWSTTLPKVDQVFRTIDAETLEAMAAEIISRAASTVLNATHYVTRALQIDPFEWSKWAFEHESERSQDAFGGTW